MKKFFVNCLCAFIPNTDKRRAFRKKLMRDRIAEIASQFEFLDKRINENNEKIAELNKAVARLDVEKQNVFHEPTEYVFHGENNKLLVWDNDKNDYVETTKVVSGLEVFITGNNNVVKIGCPEILQGLTIILEGNNHKVNIGRHTEDYEGFIRNSKIFVADWTGRGGCEFVIGDNVRINDNVLFVLTESGHKVFIGNNCRFAENSVLFAADGHSVVNNETGELLNKAKRPVVIGNNCWIGLHSFLGKNTQLPDYTIVAAMSVVTRKFDDSYTIIAGNPAKVVKMGVRRVDYVPDVYEDLKKNNMI